MHMKWVGGTKPQAPSITIRLGAHKHLFFETFPSLRSQAPSAVLNGYLGSRAGREAVSARLLTRPLPLLSPPILVNMLRPVLAFGVTSPRPPGTKGHQRDSKRDFLSGTPSGTSHFFQDAKKWTHVLLSCLCADMHRHRNGSTTRRAAPSAEDVKIGAA